MKIIIKLKSGHQGNFRSRDWIPKKKGQNPGIDYNLIIRTKDFRHQLSNFLTTYYFNTASISANMWLRYSYFHNTYIGTLVSSIWNIPDPGHCFGNPGKALAIWIINGVLSDIGLRTVHSVPTVIRELTRYWINRIRGNFLTDSTAQLTSQNQFIEDQAQLILGNSYVHT
jgi:hypothetical protein